MSTLKEWAGGDRATLAIVFTDIVGSTAFGRDIGDERMDQVREDHFTQGERLIAESNGRMIKSMGDGLIAVFHSVGEALDFSRRFLKNPGARNIEIRCGIHVGSVEVKNDDIQGINVTVASRVVSAFKGAEIWLSNEAMTDLDHHRPERFARLSWIEHHVTPNGLNPTSFWQMSTEAAPVHKIFRAFTSNLPAVDSLLIGREKELDFLDQAWANSKTNIVQIVAPGGTGKTALMDKWYKRHLNECTIFAWSFYTQGTKQDRQTSSDDFFAEIIPFFGITIPQGASIWARAEAVARRLREEKVLLILDGLEPLQESTGEVRDSAMKALLHELRTHNAGMALTTTRIAIKDLFHDEPSQSLNLDNLTPEDGATLLRHKGVIGTDEELEEASIDFHNHALAVTLLGTYLAEFHNGDIRARTDIRGLLSDESDQDGHANRVMASYVKMLEGKPELEKPWATSTAPPSRRLCISFSTRLPGN
jgi:class 3 adenylate cyclase